MRESSRLANIAFSQYECCFHFKTEPEVRSDISNSDLLISAYSHPLTPKPLGQSRSPPESLDAPGGRWA
jgi:hypothetical protein